MSEWIRPSDHLPKESGAENRDIQCASECEGGLTMKEYIDRSALIEEINFQKRTAKTSWPKQSFVVGDVLTCIYSAPAADVVAVAPELRKSVKLLNEEYEKAKKAPHVRDPLAYTLYQVWKKVNGRDAGG